MPQGGKRQIVPSKKIRSIVPGGYTKHIQASDVSWNKPFKALVTQKYDKCLAEKGINQETPAENLKAPPRHFVVNWIIKACKETTNEVIKKSFKTCALNLLTDGSEENMIHFFKNDQLCNTGKEMLASQLSILSEKDENPFIDVDDEDINMTAPVFMSTDSDQQDDTDIESC